MTPERTVPSKYADLALALYAEETVGGRQVLLVGDASSALVERLLRLGARHVTVADPDPRRARVEAARPRRDLRVVPYDGRSVPLPDGAFGLAIVPDFGALATPELVDELGRVLADDGVLVAAAGNPDAPRALGAARAAVPYYELYDLFAARFGAVRMLGQSPFVGWAVVDFAAAGADPTVALDGSLLETPEEAERFVVLCAGEDVTLEPYLVVQAPMGAVLGSDESATEIGSPLAVARIEEGAARAEAELLRVELAGARATLDGARAELAELRVALDEARAAALAAEATLEQKRALLEESRQAVSAGSAELVEVRAALRTTEHALVETRSKVQSLNAEMARRAPAADPAELASLRARIAALEEELGARDDERDAQNAYAEDLERELEERDARLRAQEEGAAAARRQAEAATARAEALAAELDGAHAAVAGAQAELVAQQAALDAAQQASAQLEHALAASRLEVEQLRADRAEDVSGDYQALERVLRDRADRLRALEAELARRESLVRTMAAELAELQERAASEGAGGAEPAQAVSALREALDAAQGSLAERAQVADRLASELGDARERLVDLEARRTAAVFRIDELSSELLVARAETDRTRAELVAARAAEAEAQQAGRRALDEMRALSEALDDVDEDRARLSGALLGVARRVAELEAEREARRLDPGSDPRSTEELDAARGETRALAVEMEALRAREAELVGTIRGLALRNRELSAEIDDAARRAARADEDAWASMAARTALTSTASELEERCARAESERDEAVVRASKAEATVHAMTERLDDASLEIARMRAIEASLGERLLDVQRDLGRAEQKRAELQTHEDSLKIEAARLSALCSSFQDRAEGLSQELEGTRRGFRARLAELSAELDRRAHRERIVAGEARFLRERMQEWTERLEAGERAATQALEELAERSDEIGAVREQLARAGERAAALAGERDGLRLRIRSLETTLAVKGTPRPATNGAGSGEALAALSTEAAELRGERDGLRLRARELQLAIRGWGGARLSGGLDGASPVAVPVLTPGAPAADLGEALRRAGDLDADRRELQQRLARAEAELDRREGAALALGAQLDAERHAVAEGRERLTLLERSVSDLKWYLGERDAKVGALEEELRATQARAEALREQLDHASRAVTETQQHLEARIRHLEGELGQLRGAEGQLGEELAEQRARATDAERRATQAAQQAAEAERRLRSAEEDAARLTEQLAAAADRGSPQGEGTRPDPLTASLQREAEEREVLLRSLTAQLEERDDRVRLLEQRLQQLERAPRAGDGVASVEARRLAELLGAREAEIAALRGRVASAERVAQQVRDTSGAARVGIEGLATEPAAGPLADRLRELARLLAESR